VQVALIAKAAVYPALHQPSELVVDAGFPKAKRDV
jgi:hypothetical protein